MRSTFNPKTTRYRKTTVNGATVQMHRLIMERALGRKLGRKEYVHHKNEIKTDNSVGNLEVTSPLEHNRHHHGKHPVERKCAVCLKTFRPKDRRNECCGRSCGATLGGARRARLDCRQVSSIRALRRRGVAVALIAKRYGVHPMHVYAICNGRSRKTLTHRLSGV